MTKIPENIQYDFGYYKQHNNFQCTDCGQNDEHFTYLKIDLNDNIFFQFNCLCGHNSFVRLSYDELRQLYFADQSNTFWKIFHMASYFDECFEFEKDKSAYLQVVKRFNRDTERWRFYWNRRRYGT